MTSTIVNVEDKSLKTEVDISQKPYILLVDDEEIFVKTMSLFLSKRGFIVETASTAPQALSLLSSKEFNLLVTDLNMPGMDGVELIRKVREIKPHQKILVFTGFPSRESQEEAYRLGAINYIVKPFTSERFLELLRKALTVNDEGLLGPVELTFEDLIQVYAQQQKSLLIEIQKGGEKGYIYFKKGRIIHAETKNNIGVEAFYEIQSWKAGRFKADNFDSEVKQTIDTTVDALLLEGARIEDEKSKSVTKPSPAKKTRDLSKEDRADVNKSQRRQSMPSMIEEINSALKDLADNTPGLSLSLLVDNEGLPVARYTSVQMQEGAAERVAVASLALLGLARRNTDQLGLQGFQEVLIKADTGYIYSVSVGGSAGYVLVARTDQSVTLGALFMTVRTARERINKAMGITL
jgi:CheY-like chemotaxis protein/predicted regulator of Ras-like GTPase activity (Roadblock/LC7/MglB family)